MVWRPRKGGNCGRDRPDLGGRLAWERCGKSSRAMFGCFVPMLCLEIFLRCEEAEWTPR